ncbi:MAG: hypothetical protein JXA46_04155 [Dehalococcoidales bacterium]|nr:hypothetical protein [Dehalococcoidales bacterium]
MIAGLMDSAITFRKCTLEKIAFIVLNAIDLGLTVFAVSHGARELNALFNAMLDSPALLLLVKIFLPVVFAWLVPGKLLIPAIAVLFLVVGWNIHELCFILN